jgi:hypothetical protein
MIIRKLTLLEVRTRRKLDSETSRLGRLFKMRDVEEPTWLMTVSISMRRFEAKVGMLSPAPEYGLLRAASWATAALKALEIVMISPAASLKVEGFC